MKTRRLGKIKKNHNSLQVHKEISSIQSLTVKNYGSEK